MAIAGKVAITPKGEWNANTAYTKLDLVFYENASYIAIQPSTGVTPTNTAYWMLVVQSAGGADLEAIINGTTQVGNALTLDGHGAEYFAPLSYFANRQLKKNALNSESAINAFYDDLHNNASDTSFYEAWANHSYWHSILGGGQFYVIGARTSELYGWQKATSYVNGLVQFERSLYNGVWTDWVEVFTTAGGTVNGDVTVKADDTSQRIHALQNSLRRVFQTIAPSGNYNLYDGTNSKAIIVSTADGTNTFNGHASEDLPLTGGTVGNGGMNPLSIKGAATTSLLRYFNSANELQGYLGFINDKPVFQSKTNTASELLHTGNKPKMTYTGNGDGATRTIAVNAAENIGMLMVREMGSRNFAIVTNSGYIGKSGSTIVAGNDVEESYGNLVINTTNDLFNTSGKTYYCFAL